MSDGKKKNTSRKIKIKNPEAQAELTLFDRKPMSDITVDTENPLFNALFRTKIKPQKNVQEPTVVAEPEEIPLLIPSGASIVEPPKDARCPIGERWNERTQKCEPARIEITIGEFKLSVLAKYKDKVYIPKEEDLPRLRELMPLKAKELATTMKTRGIREIGSIHDNLVLAIIGFEKTQQQKPKLTIREPTNNELPIENLEEEHILISFEDELAIKKIEQEQDKVEAGQVEANEEMPNNLPIPSTDIELTDEENKLQDGVGIEPTDIDSKEHNKFLFNKEKIEYEYNKNSADSYDFLYPDINDPKFNEKIAKKKEFHETQYDGNIYGLQERADMLCSAEFELTPHQLFVKNFMSLQTPYNCLLLYHSLGTGKTCSSIGIAEEMRSYMKQIGLQQKIIIVASPNVQQNFKLQLFDERKLKKEGNLWNLNTCIGNALLSEINPTTMQGIEKDKIISQINKLISVNYEFVGYDKFANIIRREIQTENGNKELERKKIRRYFNNRLIIIDEVHNIRISQDNSEKKKTATLLMKVAKYAENIRLILLSATPMYNNYKEIIWLTNLMNTVDKRSVIREEDVFDKDGNWLPERNDKDGALLEGGRELLSRKLTGYISYVRGENPYTFPYRIYPNVFSPENTYESPNDNKANDNTEPAIIKPTYPKIQMNNKEIDGKLQYIPVFLNKNNDYQQKFYNFVIKNMFEKSFTRANAFGQVREMPSFENMESFGYTYLKEPLEALNIVYPNPKFDEKMMPTEVVSTEVVSTEVVSTEVAPTELAPTVFPPREVSTAIPVTNKLIGGEPSDIDPDSEQDTNDSETDKSAADESVTSENALREDADIKENEELIKSMVGKQGLSNVVTYKTINKPQELCYDFKYKPEILDKYGRIFSQENIGKYSSKIAKITDCIKKSNGIVIVYSQYIDGGVVPLALSLEEMGFSRYGYAQHTKNLFDKPPIEPLDSLTMKPYSEFKQDTTIKHEFKPAKYLMITGDKHFSPNNLADLKYITNPENKNGEAVKVILITQAAAEGLDFKNIRQIHIMTPWYNMNRSEQIIGRGVRNLSHCQLPFEERNVEIYLHATLPEDTVETVDLYVYRFAEKKAIKIGMVTRLLKEIAVDCLLNISQTNFTVDKLLSMEKNKNIKLKLASKKEIEYKIGDRPFTEICDYMDNCNFTCSPNVNITESSINENTYNEEHSKMNYAAIVKRIRQLYKEQSFYTRDTLISLINLLKIYPVEHIDYVLSKYIDNTNELLNDQYGRPGYLINSGQYYAFQPVELTDETASVFERSVPVPYKHDEIRYELPKEKIATNPKIETTRSVVPGLDTNILVTYDLDVILKYISDEIEKVKIEIEKIGKENMKSGDVDWFKHLGRVFSLLTNVHNIPDKNIMRYAYFHLLDTMQVEEKLILLDNLDNEKIVPEIKLYFDGKIFENKGQRGIVLYKVDSYGVYVENDDNKKWTMATTSQIRNFDTAIQKNLGLGGAKINDLVGFMSPFKKGEIVFKTKDMTEAINNRGAKCNSAGKKDIIFRINQLIKNNPYMKPDDERYEYNDKNSSEILKWGLCVILEIIMRFYNDNESKKSAIVWFFDVDRALSNKLSFL